MTFRLELYLKGAFMIDKEVIIPEPNKYFGFKRRCQLKEANIEAEVVKFKLEYIRQILKAEYEYQIHLILTSRIEQIKED
jgi:hypothetical protein